VEESTAQQSLFKRRRRRRGEDVSLLHVFVCQRKVFSSYDERVEIGFRVCFFCFRSAFVSGTGSGIDQ
jgi:hypothetical protein